MGKLKKLTVIGWIFFLLLMYFFTRTRAGYQTVFYSLVLILVLLLVGNYKVINSVITKDV